MSWSLTCGNAPTPGGIRVAWHRRELYFESCSLQAQRQPTLLQPTVNSPPGVSVKRLLAILFVAAAALPLVANAQKTDTLAKIKAAQSITVAFSGDSLP